MIIMIGVGELNATRSATCRVVFASSYPVLRSSIFDQDERVSESVW